jgi:RNA polymerase sigma-70 factor (ECF subfamily)
VNSTHEETDGDLAARAAVGDERAFTRLMRRHKGALYRFVRRYVGDPEEAYDLLQESFTAAWVGIGRYDCARPFDVWLRRIALNKCRDWSRRRFVRRLVQPKLAEPSTLSSAPDPSPAPDVGLVERAELAALDRAIAGLPASLKEPLLLTAFDGYTQAEAGDMLGLTPKAVEVRVYRARAALKATLQIAP